MHLVAVEDRQARRGLQARSLSASSNLVRVDLARLDELMRMIGEMVTSRARIEDQVKQVEEESALGRMAKSVGDHADHGPANEGSSRRRDASAHGADRRGFRADAIRRSGPGAGKRKTIVLEVLGRETEIDKFLVERMMDPLLHLVRNAVSHGLERPDERQAQGKPAEGHLTLRATTTGESVVIEIADDGRGIDVAQVTDRAKAKGILEPDVGLTMPRCSN